jgi:hypothetical protein
MLLSKAASAAAVLAISEWQTYRLLAMDEDGGRLLIHNARGRESNHSLNPGLSTPTLGRHFLCSCEVHAWISLRPRKSIERRLQPRTR